MLRSGLIGRAIMASRSPWLHEEEARAQALALSYELFDFDQRGLDDRELGAFVRGLAAAGYCGFNVTYPFKQAVIARLDALAESAELVGAVNTVAISDGRLIGHNTDMAGFRASLAAGLPDAALDRVLQLGAGGAGAAVASALLSHGVGVLTIADVDPARAEALAAALATRFGAGRVAACASTAVETTRIDGIVNATPMGMALTPGMAIAAAAIEPRHWVADIVYFPLETELLRVSRGKGCAVLDGSGMVIAQAAMAFEIITGHAANATRMRASFFAGTD